MKTDEAGISSRSGCPGVVRARRGVRVGRVSLAFLVLGASGSLMAQEADKLVIENETVRIVLDAQRGRMLEFLPKGPGVRNVLWVNTDGRREAEAAQAGYQNWGGDKVWPTPQPFWRYALGRVWPPDETTDGGAARGMQLGSRRARLVFPLSAAFQTRLERDFELEPERAVLRIRNRVVQERPSPFPVQIWSITQVPLPVRVLFDVAPDAPPLGQPVNLNGLRTKPPLGPVALAEGAIARGEMWVAFRPGAAFRQKLGTLGRWIAGVWPDGVLLQSVAFAPQGLYPEATSLQLYHDDRYAELETLGPARLLAPGEECEALVIWQWLPAPAQDESDAELAQRLGAAHRAAWAGESAKARLAPQSPHGNTVVESVVPAAEMLVMQSPCAGRER